jgi:hypothetical protein
MNPSDLQTTRDFLLRALARVPRGTSAEALALGCASAGLPVDRTGPNSLAAHLAYLEDKKLAARLPKAHTPSLEIWRITGDGDDYLRNQFGE